MALKLTPNSMWIMALALAGCTTSRVGGQLTPPPEPRSADGLLLRASSSTRPNEDGIDPIVSQINFKVLCDVLIADVPAGALSGSAELWGHLREDALGVRLSDHLAKNGFRVGVGKSADFSQVSQVMLAARDVRARTVRLTFESEGAMELVLDAQLRERRPFVYSTDGAVSGDEYPAGATFYWVGAWHDVEHIDSVNLTLVPEIRYGRDKRRYYAPGLPQGDQYRDVGRIFNEVKFDLRQERGEFVVLAPRLKGGSALVLGRSLLTDDTNKARVRELVLMIRPRVVRTPGGP